MSKDELLSTLYNRHAAALSVVAQDGNQRVHIDAARMSLALMARELADKLYSAQPAVNAEDARIHLTVVREVEKLVEQYASDLHDGLVRGEYATVDQALVVLLQQMGAEVDQYRDEADQANTDLNMVMAENKALIAECDDLRKKVEWREFELEKANARIYGNGKTPPAAVVVQTLDALTPTPAADNGIDWSALSKEADDYRHGIEAGRWKYGQVPKKIRLELLRCASAHIAAELGRAPTMVEFDAARPAWMSLSTSNMQTFGQPWHILIDRNREIEVQP